jgi:SSS family solute:Na+ symporter
VTLSRSGETDRFGVEAVPVMLDAGVILRSTLVSSTFAPAAFNPDHTRYVARSPKAKPMAVNMYSGWWSLVVCVLVTVGVSLLTRPKPDRELRNLVLGLTPRPEEGPCSWYESPTLWATVVAVVLVAVNVVFW